MTTTETTAFVPGQTGPTSAPPPSSEGPGAADRRTLALIGGGALVLVLGIVAYFLLVAGGDSAPEGKAASAPAPAASQAAAAPAAEAPAVSTANDNPRLNHAFRNPFKPLVLTVDAAGAAGTAAAATTTGATSAAGTTSASVDTTGAADTSGAAGAVATTTTSQPTETASHRVRVAAVHGSNTSIDVVVDGKRYNDLQAGEVFAKYYKVIGIAAPRYALQFGDVAFNIKGNDAVTISN